MCVTCVFDELLNNDPTSFALVESVECLSS